MLWNDEQQTPLQHLRVIDLSVMLPGPYVTRILAQYGADVIKVENLPQGDPLRGLTDTAIFELLNQGKQSVAVNLKTRQGVQLIRQLAAEADIFVENFREGVMDRLGLGYSDMTEDNPDLMYVSLRGFSGKNTVHAGHDINFIAQSGVAEWHLEGGPYYGTQLGDLIGGTFMPLIKVLSHLSNPARQGMQIVCHMDEGFRSLFLPRAYDALRQENVEEQKRATFGYSRQFNGNMPHSRFYQCRDGAWISLSAVQSKHWETFCEVVDRREWENRREDPLLVEEMEKLFLDAPATYWEALVADREVCLFRVIPWAEHLATSTARPQLTADPLSWAGFAPNPNIKKAPGLGQDTFGVIHGLGTSNKEIAEWVQAGVLFQPETK